MKQNLLQSKLISVAQAIEMHEEYEKTLAPLIETRNNGQYQATEFAWIDFEVLKQYVTMLEEVVTLNNKDISGVRIYFGAYPESSNFKSSGVEINFPGRETIFMVPTIEVAASKLSDEFENLENLPFSIDPYDLNPLEGDFVIIEKLLHENDNEVFNNIINGKETTSLILNNLALTPPPKGHQ